MSYTFLFKLFMPSCGAVYYAVEGGSPFDFVDETLKCENPKNQNLL